MGAHMLVLPVAPLLSSVLGMNNRVSPRPMFHLSVRSIFWENLGRMLVPHLESNTILRPRLIPRTMCPPVPRILLSQSGSLLRLSRCLIQSQKRYPLCSQKLYRPYNQSESKKRGLGLLIQSISQHGFVGRVFRMVCNWKVYRWRTHRDSNTGFQLRRLE